MLTREPGSSPAPCSPAVVRVHTHGHMRAPAGPARRPRPRGRGALPPPGHFLGGGGGGGLRPNVPSVPGTVPGWHSLRRVPLSSTRYRADLFIAFYLCLLIYKMGTPAACPVANDD